MRRLLLLFSLIAVFSMAYQTSHAAKIAYMHGGTAPNAGDNVILSHLTSVGNTITLIPEATLGPDIATAVNASDLFFISSSIGSGSSRNKSLETLTKPLVNCEQANQLPAGNGNGPFGFGTGGNAVRDEAQIYIDAAHASSPLAANLTGSVTLFSTQTGSGIPSCTVGTGGNAPLFSLPIANNPAYNCMTAIDAGGKLADGATSPNKRVESHVTAENAALVTAAGWRLFLAQVYWALGQPLPDAPPTIAPASISALTLKNKAYYTSITLTNPNTNPINCNAIKITGTGSNIFSIESPKTLPLSLAGLSNGTIVVKALPTTEGITTGTLQVGYNNSASTLTSTIVIKTVKLDNVWRHQDVGAVALAGDATSATGTFTLTASGSDIWNAADQFHYMYQYADGYYQVIAKVNTLTTLTATINAWAKSGVMFRESTDAGSKFANMIVSASNGVTMQARTATGAAAVTVGTAVAGIKVPIWVKLLRLGDMFTGYYSTDGTNWNVMGSTVIPMSSTMTGGLCLTSHDNLQLNRSTYTNVTVAAPPNAVSGWTSFE